MENKCLWRRDLQDGPTNTMTMSLVEYFSFRTNRLFEKFLLLVNRTFWRKLGIVEHFPSIGSLCRALGFSLPTLESSYWPICIERRHFSRCLRSHQLVLFHQLLQKSNPKLLFLGPCCGAIEIKEINYCISFA